MAWVGAIACLVVALAQPRWGRAPAPPLPPGHDVVLVVDASRSMGAEDAVDGWVSGGLFQPGYDDWRGITTTVNRMPAAALYRRTPDDPEYRLLNIAVLHIADGKIAELTGFDATDKPWLGLPPTLSSDKVPIVDESSARAAVTGVTAE